MHTVCTWPPPLPWKRPVDKANWTPVLMQISFTTSTDYLILIYTVILFLPAMAMSHHQQQMQVSCCLVIIIVVTKFDVNVYYYIFKLDAPTCLSLTDKAPRTVQIQWKVQIRTVLYVIVPYYRPQTMFAIFNQNSLWHRQVELYTVKNLSGHSDDL